MTSVKLFAGTASLNLAENIAKSYGQDLGAVSLKKFSDGELSAGFEESVRGEHVFLIQSTYPPGDHIMELLLMMDAAKRASARKITAVIPYFGYARQDRKDSPRVAIAAKLVSDLLTTAGATRVMTCDLHAGQIQGFFDCPVDHLDGNYVFFPYIKNLGLENLVMASPDVGGLKRARQYSKALGVELVVCDKHRSKPNEIAHMQLIGNVENADVVLVDDIVDTGGTLCKAAEIIMEAGARSVRAVCTHPLLSGNAHENIQNSKLTELIITDTIPLRQQVDKIKVLSVADLFATAIRRTHNHESISSLFV